MHPLFQDIRCQLIDTRWRADGTADVRAATRTSDLVRVSTNHYLPRTFGEKLDQDGLWLALTMATVLDTRKAVLVGRSAALVLGLAVKNVTQVELGLVSGNVPRRQSWPQKAQYFREQLEPGDILDIDGVRTVNGPIALAGVFKRGGFVEGLITADALRNQPITDTQVSERLQRLTGHWTKHLGWVWSASRPGQEYGMEMSEVRALLVQKGAKVWVNGLDDNSGQVPLVVNGKVSLRILPNGPDRITVAKPSAFSGYQDVSIGVDAYRKNPNLVVNYVLGRWF